MWLWTRAFSPWEMASVRHLNPAVRETGLYAQAGWFWGPQELATGAADELTYRPGVLQQAPSRHSLGGGSSLPSLPFRVRTALGQRLSLKQPAAFYRYGSPLPGLPAISQDMATVPQYFLWASSPDSHSHMMGQKHLGLPLQLQLLRP